MTPILKSISMDFIKVNTIKESTPDFYNEKKGITDSETFC